jgi:Glutathione S-transferase, N-terminal domain
MVSEPAGKEIVETTPSEVRMPEKPTLFVCHGDDGGPRFHPCRRVQEALRGAGIEYQKVIAAHGSPIPLLRRGSRDQLFKATATKKLPTLKLPDGTVISHSRPILAWVRERASRHIEASRVSAS